jgi:hypothetical protein
VVGGRLGPAVVGGLVLAVLTGCGAKGGTPAPISTAQMDGTISSQVKSGITNQLAASTGTTYDVTADCISEDAPHFKHFKCTVTATNPSNQVDYSEATATVTCEEGGSNCIWQTDQPLGSSGGGGSAPPSGTDTSTCPTLGGVPTCG